MKIEINNLDEEYTFETFAVGNSNRFAHDAALAVAETPGDCYNPLFIYGSNGLGKTHLMHAIGNEIKKNNKEVKVLYFKFEDFYNQLVIAIRLNKVDEFRDKFKDIDVLLMDNIQFIGGKERVQEEVFSLMNMLHKNKKQIVISSDIEPKKFGEFYYKIQNNFEWALFADIVVPEYETRLEILKKKSKLDNISIDEKILEIIASDFNKDARKLEGVLHRINAQSLLIDKPITIEMANATINRIKNEEKEIKLIRIIQKVVAEYFDITVDDMISIKNLKDGVLPRRIAMYLSKNNTSFSSSKIGHDFGKIDGIIVMRSCEIIENAINEDEDMKEVIDVLNKIIDSKKKEIENGES